MEFKNLKVYWKKVTALMLAGTMVLGFTGCGKTSEKEEIGTEYVMTLDERIEDYLELTREYVKAKEIYEISPTKENLYELKDQTTNLVNSVKAKLDEKLGMKTFIFLKLCENGDKKYEMKNLENEDIVYTHIITSQNESYGEINSELILESVLLPAEIPVISIEKWSKEEIEEFIEISERIAENAKSILLTDFEIKNGNIFEVTQKNKTK